MEILKKYKWFVIGFFVLVILAAAWIGKDFLLSTDTALYGERLNDIKEVKISTATKEDMKNLLEDTAGVTSATVKAQGRIIYIVIMVDETMIFDKIKEITDGAIAKCSAKELAAYDVSVMVDYSVKTELTTFPLLGYKNKNSSTVSW